MTLSLYLAGSVLLNLFLFAEWQVERRIRRSTENLLDHTLKFYADRFSEMRKLLDFHTHRQEKLK